MQEIIRIAEEEKDSFATSAEQTEYQEAARHQFFAFVSTETSAQGVADKCKSSHFGWIERFSMDTSTASAKMISVPFENN